MVRHDGRKNDELRKISIEPGYLKYPHGSVNYFRRHKSIILFRSKKKCHLMLPQKITLKVGLLLNMH